MAVPFNTIPPAYPNVPFNFVPTTPARSPVAQRVAQSARKRPVSQTVSQVANQRVNQVLNPQIAAQNAFNARQDQVIQSFAQALLGKLTPVAGQIGGYYDQAINQTGALSNQAAQFLQNANPSGSVADLLRSAGAPQSQIDQQTAQLGQTFGSGAGVLSFLGGTVPGGQLAADKAAAQTEAAQYPLFAGLKAQQDLSSALWQQGQDMRTIQAQRPQLFQQAEQDIRTNNFARQKNQLAVKSAAATAGYRAASLAATAKHNADTLAATKQYHSDTIAARNRQIDVTEKKTKAAIIIANGIDPKTHHLTPEAVAQLKALGLTGVTGVSAAIDAANTRSKNTIKAENTRSQNTIKAENTRSQNEIDASNERNQRTIAGENARNNASINAANTRNQRTIAHEDARAAAARKAKAAAAAAKASKPKTPTAAQTTAQVSAWHHPKSTSVRVPVLDSDGKPVTNSNGVPQYVTKTKTTKGLGYMQVYRKLRAEHYSDADARRYASAEYKRGEDGRAWLTNEEKDALRKAGRQQTVGIYQGHGFIVQPQLAALEAAGLKPPGEFVNGRYFIRPSY